MADPSAQDLLDSIFKVAATLVRGERASLMLRDTNDTDFVIAKARGLAEDVMRRVRVREGEGVAGRVAATKRPLLVRDAEGGVSGAAYRSSSFMSVPIVVNDRAIGVLNVTDRADGALFDAADLETLELLANHIAACLVRQKLEGQLRELADTDALTGLFNRRHFDRRLSAEFERARRSGESTALLLIDVNAFKHINDRLGHSVGDTVLRTVAEGMRRSIRAYDIPVRYGGDEFAALLPNTNELMARRVGERIVGNFAGSVEPHIVEAVPHVGISIGIAVAPPALDVHGLVDHADLAMYRAKGEGGGVSVWRDANATATHDAIGRRKYLPTPYLADPTRLANRELQTLIPAPVAEEWNILVIGREGRVLTIVMPEPSNAAVTAVSGATGFAVYPVYSEAAEIERARRAIN